MHPQTEIRLDAIERAQKLLQAAPAPRLEEVSKSHAARILIPQIRDAQAKGYSLKAIAGLLTESGIPISASLLKTLLSEARSQTASAPESRHGPAKRRKSAPCEARSGPRHESSFHAAPSEAMVPLRPALTPKPPPHEGKTDDRSLPPLRAASIPPVPERRSSFVPRPDTKDI